MRVLRKHCINCSRWYCKRWSSLRKPISAPPSVFQPLVTPSEASGHAVLLRRCPLAAVGLPDTVAIVLSPQASKTESGNYFIDTCFPLEMNQDQDKPLYAQRRVCSDSKRRCPHRGLLLHLLPISRAGFAFLLNGFMPQLTGGHNSPKTLEKNPVSYFGSAPASPSCCVCRSKVGAVLHLAGALGSQARTAPAGAIAWRRSPVNGCTAWGEEQQSFLMSFLWVCKKISTHPAKSCPRSSLSPLGSQSPAKPANS